MNIKIGIIGGGTVGNAVARNYLGFADDVLVYDDLPERRTHDVSCIWQQADIIFVCLPEAALDDFFYNASRIGLCQLNFVIKSTMPIGTTRALAGRYLLSNLVHSPEFLSSKTAVADAMMPARNIIGNPVSGYGRAGNKAAEMLNILYHTRWPHVPVHLMSSDESEMVKLMQNSFSAVKIAFFNEMHTLCNELKLDWYTMVKALLAGGWINPMHTQVPGPDGICGFGGGCLPKDAANLARCVEDQHLPATMIRAALLRNEWDRHK